MKTQNVDMSVVGWGSVEWTALCTLYLRAYESRSAESILADRFAAEAVERIEYDFERIDKSVRPASNQFMVAVRGRQLDEWATSFLARHPDAVVVHLGCGFDSRVLRLTPPDSVDWFDLDLPGVIELRRKLYSERAHYQLIASSVTDPAWLNSIPTGRPTLVIAEGLLMFLAPDEVRRLLRLLADRFSPGELLFDAVSPLMVRLTKDFQWGMRDGEIERWDPRFKRLAEVSLMAHFPRIPVKGIRRVYRTMNVVPVTRRFNRQFRYAFGS